MPRKQPRLRILVMDDDHDTANSLAALLALWGHPARPAYDADGALKAVAEEVPDVVFIDLGMPGRDGFALAADLRAQSATRQAKLFAFTGKSVARDQALAGPFDDFYLKSVDPTVLRKLLDELTTGETPLQFGTDRTKPGSG